MSMKTTYKCDGCKKKKGAAELMHIDIRNTKLTADLKMNPIKFGSNLIKYDICEECATKLGFKSAPAKDPEPRTEADQLYDLVSNMVSECLDDLGVGGI